MCTDRHKPEQLEESYVTTPHTHTTGSVPRGKEETDAAALVSRAPAAGCREASDSRRGWELRGPDSPWRGQSLGWSPGGLALTQNTGLGAGQNIPEPLDPFIQEDPTSPGLLTGYATMRENTRCSVFGFSETPSNRERHQGGRSALGAPGPGFQTLTCSVTFGQTLKPQVSASSPARWESRPSRARRRAKETADGREARSCDAASRHVGVSRAWAQGPHGDLRMSPRP